MSYCGYCGHKKTSFKIIGECYMTSCKESGVCTCTEEKCTRIQCQKIDSKMDDYCVQCGFDRGICKCDYFFTENGEEQCHTCTRCVCCSCGPCDCKDVEEDIVEVNAVCVDAEGFYKWTVSHRKLAILDGLPEWHISDWSKMRIFTHQNLAEDFARAISKNEAIPIINPVKKSNDRFLYDHDQYVKAAKDLASRI